jgi:hypothetical protein
VTHDGNCEGMNDLRPEVLVLRAWIEPAAEPRLRVRVIAVRPGLPEQSVLSSTSIEDTCDAVRAWLTSLGPAVP